MDQKKTGAFLKELRKEKKLTQEQLAEILQVSNRTVSRWENGANLPDLDLLIQIADYYEVELGELLDGERREQVADTALGFAYGIMLVGVLYISGHLRKWKAVKRRLMKNLS